MAKKMMQYELVWRVLENSYLLTQAYFHLAKKKKKKIPVCSFILSWDRVLSICFHQRTKSKLTGYQKWHKNCQVKDNDIVSMCYLKTKQ